MRILLVDDDPGLRALLRTTFETVDIAVDEAESTTAAKAFIRFEHPDVVVLDVRMPGVDGLSLCRELKDDPHTRHIGVILLTGSDDATERDAREAGADGYLRKPFRPLELLAIAERIAGDALGLPFQTSKQATPEQQLLLYARDLRHLLEIERGQRRALQSAYYQTVSALGTALESRDVGTSAHSQRVQRFALELARLVAPELAEDPSVECGFLLHDVGKLGIPDEILRKPGPLHENERRVMQMHTVEGAKIIIASDDELQLAAAVAYEHHIMINGGGYPTCHYHRDCHKASKLVHVCDVFDALRTNRPYRAAWELDRVLGYIEERSGTEFDPDIVKAFVPMMRALEGRMQVTPLQEARDAGSEARDAGDAPGAPPVQGPPGNPLPFPPPAATPQGSGNPDKPGA
jgi:putative two-component system response regulator